MTKTEMRRAAKILREEAAQLKRSHTVDGVWEQTEAEVKAEYDEWISLARKLDAHALTLPHAKLGANCGNR